MIVLTLNTHQWVDVKEALRRVFMNLDTTNPWQALFDACHPPQAPPTPDRSLWEDTTTTIIIATGLPLVENTPLPMAQQMVERAIGHIIILQDRLSQVKYGSQSIHFSPGQELLVGAQSTIVGAGSLYITDVMPPRDTVRIITVTGDVGDRPTTHLDTPGEGEPPPRAYTCGVCDFPIIDDQPHYCRVDKPPVILGSEPPPRGVPRRLPG